MPDRDTFTLVAASSGITPDNRRRFQVLAAEWALGQEDPERELQELLAAMGLLREV